jgi:phosphoglycolate phosphatase
MSQPIKDIRTILFDLDGTLVDSAPDLIGALDMLMIEQGRSPIGVAEGRAMIGDGAARLVERGFVARGGAPAALPELVARFMKIYEGRLTRETRSFDGVIPTLEALAARGLALGVCTNKPDHATHALLEALGLARFFSAVVGGDGVRKPDPEPVNRCLDALGGKRSQALFVGDSPVDMAAARAAGIPIVLVSFGYTAVPARALGADRVIDRFEELVDLLRG